MGRGVVAALTGCCLLALVASAQGLRCYVCNSKADSRCADPMQTAQEPAEGQDGGDSTHGSNSNNNNVNNNYNNNNNNRYDEGLQMVDCKVAHNVRQAMDAVSGLLSRLGQRAPGGGDVWAAVRASTQASMTAAGAHSGLSPRQGQQHGGGLVEQRGGQRGDQHQGGHKAGHQGGQREEEEATAACHKVDMEVDGEMVTDRGCAPGRILDQDPCEALAAALGETESCELCDGDGCNTASTATASITAAVVLLGHGLPHVLWRP